MELEGDGRGAGVAFCFPRLTIPAHSFFRASASGRVLRGLDCSTYGPSVPRQGGADKTCTYRRENHNYGVLGLLSPAWPVGIIGLGGFLVLGGHFLLG
jgi:hypothetical protein